MEHSRCQADRDVFDWREHSALYHEEAVGRDLIEEDWRDPSCGSCSDSDFDGWPALWHDEVGSREEIFYMECNPQDILDTHWKDAPGATSYKNENLKSSRSWKKGARGTLLKLVGRNNQPNLNSKLSMPKPDPHYAPKERHPTLQGGVENYAMDKLHESQGSEIHEVRMLVEPRRHNLGRRASLCEVLLGIIPGYFPHETSDRPKIMVAGFIPDMEISDHQKIRPGDWFYCIDGQEVTHKNIDNILSTITSPCVVTLGFRRITIVQRPTQNEHTSIPKGLEVEEFLQLMCQGATSEHGGSVALIANLIANPDQRGEDEQPDEVLYFFPQDPQCKVVSARGMFLTLMHAVPELTQSSPRTSSLDVGGHMLHVVYFEDENNLVLFAFPSNRGSKLSAIELSTYFMKAIQFSYRSFTRAVLEQKTRLDFLVDWLFHQCSKIEAGYHIQHILPTSEFIPLSQNAQTDIHNALSELESADFNKKMDSHINSGKIFSILGSCFLYKGLTVSSHLPEGMLSQLQAFCWLHAINASGLGLKRLLTWKQIFPQPMQIASDEYPLPGGRYFLLLLGENHQVLAVILQAGDHSLSEDILGPNIFYVEHAQSILDMLNQLGISGFLDSWLEKKLNPLRDESSHFSAGKQTPLRGATSAEQLMRSLRLNSGDQGMGSTSRSFTAEGSVSLSSLSQRGLRGFKQTKVSARSSENSDETCSQSATEALIKLTSDTSSEDSWDVNKESGDPYKSLFGSKFPLQGLAVPSRLLENAKDCLLHFIHLDVNLGIILTSNKNPKTDNMGNLIANFHRTSLIVRSMLKNSKPESGSRVQNSTAANEIGILFEQTDEDSRNVVYWVVGRMLNFHHRLREIYVCYEDCISLNVVEFAFRIAQKI